MSVLSATERARCEAKITNLTAQIAALNDTLDEAITTGGIKEFRFDSGEGSQRVEYRSPEELSKQIYWLERQLEACYQKLNGTDIVNINQRRKIGTGLNRARY